MDAAGWTRESNGSIRHGSYPPLPVMPSRRSKVALTYRHLRTTAVAAVFIEACWSRDLAKRTDSLPVGLANPCPLTQSLGFGYVKPTPCFLLECAASV